MHQSQTDKLFDINSTSIEQQDYEFLPASIELVHLLASSVGTSEPLVLQTSNFRLFAASRGLNCKNI